MTRSDLAALDDDALAVLANRGLVKRSAKDISKGNGPTVTELDDGTVEGRFADGTLAGLPPGTTLEDAPCTCSASGLCRHRLMTVMVYRDTMGAEADVEVDGPPPASDGAPVPVAEIAETTDEALQSRFGKTAMSAAERARKRGLRVTVRMDEDPLAVDLPNCTVRFLAGSDLAHIHVDATGAAANTAGILAVWAWQEATRRGADDQVVFQLGGQAVDVQSGPLEALAQSVHQLIEHGVVNSEAAEARLAETGRLLGKAGWQWPALGVDDLILNLNWYRTQNARYDVESVADILTELDMRMLAAHGDGELGSGIILGIDQPGEVKMRHTRLTALGCRVDGGPSHRQVEVYFAHPDSATVLVAQREWEFADDQEPLAGHDLARRVFMARTALRDLSAGHLVSENVHRRANQALRIGRGSLASTSVLRSSGDWEAVDHPLRVTVAALSDEFRRRPLPQLAPRLLASTVRVIDVAEVEAMGFNAGSQTIRARLMDTEGTPFMVAADYRTAAPGAVDAIGLALDGTNGEVRRVAGTCRLDGGMMVVEPTAIVGDQVMVPDLAVPAHTDLGTEPQRGGSPSALALREAQSVLSDGAHRGLRHVGPGYAAELRTVAERLEAVGLEKTSASMGDLARSLTASPSDDEQSAVEAWQRAATRLAVANHLVINPTGR